MTERNVSREQGWAIAIEVVRNELPKIGGTHRDRAKALGIGSATLSEFLAGEMTTSLDTIRKINLGLNWPRGYLAAIIEGERSVIERYVMEDRDLQLYTLRHFDRVTSSA